MRIILASKSPARLATLKASGITPEVLVSALDENQISGDSPANLALNLAEAKAKEVLATHFPQEVLLDSNAKAAVEVTAGTTPEVDFVLFACDSILEFSGEIHGKPRNIETAKRWWQAMSGKSGVLYTGHFVAVSRAGKIETRKATTATTVHFAKLSEAEIDAYLATEEPLWVAGGFTIDGYGAAFISKIEGDHHNVVGISLPTLRELLLELEIPWHSLWQQRNLSN